jgi:hypothetical protein
MTGAMQNGRRIFVFSQICSLTATAIYPYPHLTAPEVELLEEEVVSSLRSFRRI